MVKRKEITVTLMIGKAVVLAVEVTEVVVEEAVAQILNLLVFSKVPVGQVL